MKKLLLLLVSLIVICETTTAQNYCNRWYVDLNYTYLTPLDNFRTGGFKGGHGLSVGGYYDLTPNAQKATLHTGFRFNGTIGKSAKDKITLEDPVDATAKSRVYNTIVDVQALSRIIFQPRGKWSPYIGAHGGLRVTTGHEKLKLIGNYPDYNAKPSSQVISRGNWNWGGNIGGLYQLNSILDFDIRLSADYSPELDYINMKSYEEIGDILIYDFSKTNALDLKIHIGIRAKLVCNRNLPRNKASSRNSSSNRSTKKRKKRKPSKKKSTPKSSSKSKP